MTDTANANIAETGGAMTDAINATRRGDGSTASSRAIEPMACGDGLVPNGRDGPLMARTRVEEHSYDGDLCAVTFADTDPCVLDPRDGPA